MSSDEKQEGLVLRSIDYKDHQKIITLFTKNKGIISLIVKGISRKKTHLLTLTSPFTQAEYHFKIGRSDLYTFCDATPINTHQFLRNQLDFIQSASLISKALLSSQLPEKPAPILYRLTLAYLKYLPEFSNFLSLTASYLLKLLKHDGLLNLSPICAQCNQPSNCLHNGEPRCQTHRTTRSILIEPDWETLKILTQTKSLATLKETLVSSDLHQKIEKIFTEITNI